MNEQRERIRCRSCELIQWDDRSDCRRCGAALPQPIVKIVERVVEKVILQPCARCGESTEVEAVEDDSRGLSPFEPPSTRSGPNARHWQDDDVPQIAGDEERSLVLY